MADKQQQSGKGTSQKSGGTIRRGDEGSGRRITANTGQKPGQKPTTDSTGPRKTK